MFWSQENVDKFPRCTLHMKTTLQPDVLKKQRKKIYDAFVKACEDEARAVRALRWGNDPDVGAAHGIITIGQRKMCGFNPPEFFNQNARKVIISDIRIIPLEACVDATDMFNNQTRFECTLLHELVHVVRSDARKPDVNWDFPDSEEPGNQFELWAYGRLLCTEADVADAQATIF